MPPTLEDVKRIVYYDWAEFEEIGSQLLHEWGKDEPTFFLNKKVNLGYKPCREY